MTQLPRQLAPAVASIGLASARRTDSLDKAISADWAVKGWPTVVVLDAEGEIHYRGHDGEAATDVVRELLAKHQ